MSGKGLKRKLKEEKETDHQQDMIDYAKKFPDKTRGCLAFWALMRVAYDEIEDIEELMTKAEITDPADRATIRKEYVKLLKTNPMEYDFGKKKQKKDEEEDEKEN